MKWIRLIKYSITSKYENREKNYLKIVVTMMIVIFLSPGVIITASSVRGEGITFSAIVATMETAKVMNNIMDNDFGQSAQYLGFFEHCDQKSHKKKSLSNKQCFINGLEGYFNEERALVDYSKIEFATDDYFTEGSIELIIAEGRDYYTVNLNLTRQNDKLYLMNVTSITANHEDKEKLDQFTKQFKKVLYNNSSEK